MMRHTHTRHLVSTWVALLLAAVLCPYAQAQDSWRFEEAPRVVAFADVHGAYTELVELLQATGVIDADLRWTSGATHVVSLGDLLDRGPDARRVLDLVMRLQDEARAAGGAVHVVLGNHELMNLIGDWRYVSAADYASFAADETADERATAYTAFAANSAGADEAETRAEFDRSYPPGYFARRRAFAADGHYGAWLLRLPAIVVVNDTAYVHGGLPPLVAESGLELNAQLAKDLQRYLALRRELADAGVLPRADWQNDRAVAHEARSGASRQTARAIDEFTELGDAAELSSEGPLWYRGDVYCKPLLEAATVTASLERLGARRAVVGHTPTPDRRVHTRYDGRIVMLDTGMLTGYFNGRPSALVSEGDRTYVQYTMPPEQAALDTSGDVQAYGLTAATLHDALEHGEVAAVDRTTDAAWQVTLKYENDTIGAAFYPQPDGAGLELAAAAIDDLLGAGLVTMTVQREIEGQQGALQLRYPDATTEAERRERRLGAGARCPLEPQLAMMRAFDLLIGNHGRKAENVVFNDDLSDLTLTDHRLAFDAEFKLPPNFDRRKLGLPTPFLTALQKLDRESLETVLDAWLDPRQIAAVIARRGQLLSH
jgi:Calcineurin-like phosphoesterase